jgi:hypothetical protein
MSWSDDTRCLYCEGRLPLYRKITHGQFCSSAHRKAYWQDQERLAIERLHQTHDSLRSYRSQPQIEAPEGLAALSSQRLLEAAEAVSSPLADLYPDPASNPIEPHPDDAPLTVCDLLGALAPEILARSGSALELVAPDPFEYEIAGQPLPPSAVWSVPPPSSLPEGHPVPAWACLSPRTWTGQAWTEPEARVEECNVALCHPGSQTPALEMRAAGRVGLPPTVSTEARGTAAPVESTLQALDIAMAPVSDVVFKVTPQGDVLVELLDQQVPHPDGLHALAQFAAHQPAFAPVLAPIDAELDPPARQAEVSAALSPVVPDYQLSLAAMRQLSAVVSPAQGNFVIPATVSEIPVNPQAGISAASMPALAESDYQVGTAGLQNLPSSLLHPAQGNFVIPATISEIPANLQAGISSASMPALAESDYQVGTAGLQSLSSSLLLPAQGVYALQTSDSMAFDLSAGVSSDTTLPGLTASASAAWTPQLAGLLALTFGKKRKVSEAPRPEPVSRLFPQAIEMQPMLPLSSGLEPMDRKPPEDALRAKGSGLGALMHGEGLGKLEPVWAHATGFWQHAPRDLKLLLFAIPALLALVFYPKLPRVAFAAPQSSGSGFTRVLNDQLVSVRQTLENRAAIALDEDFRSGLDNWASPGGSTTEWSFDSTGFVRPGPLALYRPSVSLGDYQVQFMGMIDKKAMSWVVRAADFENFYVVKLVVVKSGPIPAIGLTRYAVIGGKAQDRHDVNIPLSARNDTLYRIRMDLQGSNFSVEVQGQMADSWTETRLPRGGVGFFTARGEESRVRWVQIMHQYDMLGRLCAYLAPYDTTNGSWQP